MKLDDKQKKKRKEYAERKRRLQAMREMRHVRMGRGARRDVFSAQAKRGKRRDTSSEYIGRIRDLFMSGMPYTKIGAALGKDHTTIIYQVRKLGLIHPAQIRSPKVEVKRPVGSRMCEMPECPRPVTAHGLCHAHYMQTRRRQDEENRRRSESTPGCRHDSSRCECVNRGMKSYADYVRAAGMRLPTKSKDL